MVAHRAILLVLACAGATAAVPAAWIPPSEVGAGWRSARPEDFRPAEPAFETFRDWPPDALLEQAYWFPWSWASFQRASLFHRPVFFLLTVNWSRPAQALMEQALADPEVQRAINAGYVMVRVNADLRPDIRERYQTGVWPLVAFLLPNGYPMLSQATDLAVARPITMSAVDAKALRYLVEEGTVYWDRWPGVLVEAAEMWVEREGPVDAPVGSVDARASEVTSRWLLANADRVDGGFGAVPKFIVPGLEEYGALRESRGLPELRAHSRLTLERLVASALYDGREGGIHRIATGLGFTEIQYEKMLEGNAALLRELTVSVRGRDSAELRAALSGTGGFITRVLGRPDGGLHLAQVADPGSPDGGAYWKGGERPAGEPPPVDPLVLSGPTAVAGAALLRAGMLVEDERLVTSGKAALDRVLESALDAGRGVRHAIGGDEHPGTYLVSQADAAWGFIDAYETTGDRRYRDAARVIVDFARLNLADADAPALRDVLPQPHAVGLLAKPRRPLRPNVRLARAMLRLALHGQGESYRQEATRILGAFSGDLAPYRAHGIEAALAIEELITDPLLIRISGPPDDPEVRALRRAAVNATWPWTVVLTDEREKGRPGAELQHGKRKKSVRSAADLPEAVRDLTARGERGGS